MRVKRTTVFRLLRILLLSSGSFFLLSCILAFTTLPFYARYWLGTHKGCIDEAPESVVLMGGSGMPSENGLLRCYYTALLGKRYPMARIIIALPGDTSDSLSSPCLMKNELEIRGINRSRISFENSGHNTREQALKIADIIGEPGSAKTLAIVSSPEHMYRTLLSFEKVGFSKVKGLPTFENSIEEVNLYFNDKELKGNSFMLPIGHSKQLRYQFWNHLRYEILVLREVFALTYYKLKAWI